MTHMVRWPWEGGFWALAQPFGACGGWRRLLVVVFGDTFTSKLLLALGIATYFP
jgi:hypothetical protein